VRNFDPQAFEYNIANAIALERMRQDHLRTMGHFALTLADGALAPAECLAVLGEEFGEVSREVCEQLAGNGLDVVHLREELVQLAACCVAWIEALDSGDAEPLSGPDSGEYDSPPATEPFPLVQTAPDTGWDFLDENDTPSWALPPCGAD
jgi:hypothetical protein